ncbi:MAG: FKBP-type peptidyl-prolyl cis-trans isomerase [Acidobacteriota bacterium]
MRRFYAFACVTLLTTLMSCNSTPKAVELKTDEDKTIYALGLAIGNQIKSFNLSEPELTIVKQALSDSLAGKPAVKIEEWGPKLNDLNNSRQGKAAVGEKAKGKEYQDKAAAEAGATKLPSGVVYKELKAGTGASPTATSNVKVHYKGTLISGEEFDSSYKRNEPAEFPLNGVIPCWTEGVQRMKVGGKAQLVCPSEAAYGDNGRPPQIPGGATLVFEVELLEVK